LDQHKVQCVNQFEPKIFD